MDRRNFLVRLVVAILALFGIKWEPKVTEEMVSIIERWELNPDGSYSYSRELWEDAEKRMQDIDQ